MSKKDKTIDPIDASFGDVVDSIVVRRGGISMQNNDLTNISAPDARGVPRQVASAIPGGKQEVEKIASMYQDKALPKN